MGPRSAGFDEIEAGYVQQMAEEEALLAAQYNSDDDEEEEKPRSDDDEDELALAERQYLSEMQSGMHVTDEDESGM